MSETLNSSATQDQSASDRPRLIIEDWLPIAALGEESVRERRSMTALPPTYYLHVWWARRPLVASRAAILGSLLPADADREKFMHVLGIHGDPVAAKDRIAEATRKGERLGAAAYGYTRAFSYTPTTDDLNWFDEHTKSLIGELPTVLDPTAGGGSIPFEAVRLGSNVVANDLNPVAGMILKATVELPRLYGSDLLNRYLDLGQEWARRCRDRLKDYFLPEPESDCIPDAYLWARTITCPYCAGLVPLSPNWRLNGHGTGVRLVPFFGKGLGDSSRHCSFKIVQRATEHSPGTVKGGNAVCPYSDCARPISGDVIKGQAKEGKLGQQLYAIVYNRLLDQGRTKTGKIKNPKKERGFRAPREEDNNQGHVQSTLGLKLPEWIAQGIVPNEEIPEGMNTKQVMNFGFKKWTDFFSPRQLLGHGTAVEVYHELWDEFNSKDEVQQAAFLYLAIAIDKMLDWNSLLCMWHPNREVLAHTFSDHHFCLKMGFSEMAPIVPGLGYDWVVRQTGKALKELIGLCGTHESRDGEFLFPTSSGHQKISVTNTSATALLIEDASVDSIVMDPPYYDNVMYADIADFFYVWLKRTAGKVIPEHFFGNLTNKDDEAVANAHRFKGQDNAPQRARQDYQAKMASIFSEAHRVLKPHGSMVVMFTHKASGAWDALATGLVQANFAITASWPVNSEAESSLRIREKSAAKSTIFLVCRPKAIEAANTEVTYWEDIEPQVTHKVRERLAEFQAGGITGVDLYLACFGPALQVFSEAWPLTRGTPVPEPKDWDADLFKTWDPYCVRPEDALDAARREVKRWRMDQLATITRQHHLDELTEFFILAWDAFRAPRFPADEALKLARVVGLDFDRDLKNVILEVKGGDVIIWDSKTRQAKGKLGPISQAIMLDTLHHAALASHAGNTGTAKEILERAKLLEDPTLKAALQAFLNVLPPTKGSDFEALNRLRGLAFPNMDVSDAQLKLYEQMSLEAVAPASDEDETSEDE